MSIQFRCVQCNKRVQAPDSAGGKNAKCPVCGQLNEVPIFNPDQGDPLAGFDQFVATHGSNIGNPPPPPPRQPAGPTADEIPDFLIRTRQPNSGRATHHVKRTPMQIVALSCAVAIVALYALFGLATGAMMLSGEANGYSPGEAISGLILGPPLLVAACMLYLGPSILAYIREHQNAVPIFIVNLLFGWAPFPMLPLVWVGCLAWAFSSNVRESRQYIRQVIIKESPENDL